MTIETEFAELFTQTVTVEPFDMYDSYAQPQYKAGTEYTARTVHKNRMVRDATGKEVVSTATTWVYGAPGITVKDRITLPNGNRPVILSVERYPDENGDHHEKVLT